MNKVMALELACAEAQELYPLDTQKRKRMFEQRKKELLKKVYIDEIKRKVVNKDDTGNRT